jgi:hypothetical protein
MTSNPVRTVNSIVEKDSLHGLLGVRSRLPDHCLFVWIFTAHQQITGHIVPNAIIGLKCYVKLCK